MKLDLPVDSATEIVLQKLIDSGLNPLIVGGAVRDAIRGEKPKDFDIEVHGAKNFEQLRSALKALGPLNLTGRDFGVMKLRVRLANGKLSEEIDLALPRRDSKTGEGHRGFSVEVDPTMSLREATARRDLTVNALVWDSQTKLVIDLHGGLKDLEDGVLRHVSEAFSEDPLRVLRVARFAAKLGFTVAPETLNLCKNLQSSFAELAVERVVGELSRMLTEASVKNAVDFLKESGWGSLVGIPEDSFELVGQKLQESIENGDKPSYILQMAIIASILPTTADIRGVLKSFAISKADLKKALAIAEAPSVQDLTKAEARQWAWDNQNIAAADKITVESVVTSADLNATRLFFEELNVLTQPEKDEFDADALIAAHKSANPGLKNGPWIREVLRNARSEQYAR